MKYKCPCCDGVFLEENPDGEYPTYEICKNCWYQIDGAEEGGGANKYSLKESRINYQKYGHCDGELK